jgi:hypothetical protein
MGGRRAAPASLRLSEMDCARREIVVRIDDEREERAVEAGRQGTGQSQNRVEQLRCLDRLMTRQAMNSGSGSGSGTYLPVRVIFDPRFNPLTSAVFLPAPADLDPLSPLDNVSPSPC